MLSKSDKFDINQYVNDESLRYSEKDFNRTSLSDSDFHIVIEDTSYFHCQCIAGGGSKLIFDLGNGYVLGKYNSTGLSIELLTDNEIKIAEKINTVGLRTQKFEKVIANINGVTCPALLMPSFKKLTRNGQQVCDIKNPSHRLGESFVFGNLDNVRSLDHWQHIFKYITPEIAIYLINNLCLSNDSFNLVIEDSENTSALKDKCSSRLFTDLNQALHLYFFDFNDKTHLYDEHKYKRIYEFIDIHGNVIDTNIRKSVDDLKTMVFDTIFSAVHDKEVKAVFPNSVRIIPQLTDEIEDLILVIWNEVATSVTTMVSKHINDLPLAERLALYSSEKQDLDRVNPAMKNNSVHSDNFLFKPASVKKEDTLTGESTHGFIEARFS